MAINNAVAVVVELLTVEAALRAGCYIGAGVVFGSGVLEDAAERGVVAAGEKLVGADALAVPRADQVGELHLRVVEAVETPVDSGGIFLTIPQVHYVRIEGIVVFVYGFSSQAQLRSIGLGTILFSERGFVQEIVVVDVERGPLGINMLIRAVVMVPDADDGVFAALALASVKIVVTNIYVNGIVLDDTHCEQTHGKRAGGVFFG